MNMMTGTVYKVRQEDYLRKDGTTIPQRGIILHIQETTRTGRIFDDYVKFRVAGEEMSARADELQEGERVSLGYALSGTLIADRNTGEEHADCFTRVNCLRIVPLASSPEADDSFLASLEESID